MGVAGDGRGRGERVDAIERIREAKAGEFRTRSAGIALPRPPIIYQPPARTDVIGEETNIPLITRGSARYDGTSIGAI